MKIKTFICIILFSANFIYAQTITGRLIESTGNALPNLQVKLFCNRTSFLATTSFEGKFTINITASNVIEDKIPSGYAITNNYPNPFNPKTRINISMPKSGVVRIDVFNSIGQKVVNNLNKNCGAGANFVDIELNGLPNGIYFARISIDDSFLVVKKLVLMYGSKHLHSQNMSSVSIINNPVILNAGTSNMTIDSIVVSGSYINRKVFSSIPGLIGTSVNLGDLEIDVIQQNDVLVLEESEAGDFLIIDDSYQGPDKRWRLMWGNILSKIFETDANQIYDFIFACPTKSTVANLCYSLNRSIEGIGWGPSTYYKALNSKAIIQMDFFPSWAMGLEAPNNIFVRTLIHEMGHYWLANIKWANHNGIGHWQNNLDLFRGNPDFVDPVAYYHWIIKDGNEICVNGNGNVITKFSNLSLYLMGLISPEQVLPIYEQVYELIPGNEHYNYWGPACGENHKFIESKTVTIQDIINYNGVRNPSYEKSKKDFRAVFVIIAAKGEVVPPNFIDYVKKYKEILPEAWFQATSGISKIR